MAGSPGGGIWRVGDINLTTFNKPVLFMIVGAASKNAGRRAVKYIQDELSAVDRIDTGKLRDSWKSEIEPSPLGVTFNVYSDLPPLNQMVTNGYSDRFLADVVNEGSGIYGPYGSPIVSPTGGVMAFNWARASSKLTSSNMMYAYSVKGQTATGYLDRALRRIKITDYVNPA